MQELRELFWLSAMYNFHITAIYLEGFRNTTADAISRLHERGHLLAFYSFLQARFAPGLVDNTVLTDHMSPYRRYLIFFRCTRPSVGFSIATGSF